MSLNALHLERFAHVRARVTATLDGFQIGAFLTRTCRDVALFELMEEFAVEQGEELEIQFVEAGVASLYRGRALSQRDQVLTVNALSPISTTETTETPRIRLKGVCVVATPQSQVHGELIDASIGGVGIRTTLAVKIGEPYALMVKTAAGTMSFGGFPRYCRTEPERTGQYRCGFAIRFSDPRDADDWHKLLNNASLYLTEAA